MPSIYISSLLVCLFHALPIAPQGDSWSALPLPSLCREPVEAARHRRLETGRHIVFEGDDLEVRSTPGPATLPVSVLLGLLQDDSVARSLPVQFHPSAPPLLVRGQPDAVDAVRALVQDLDRAGRDLEVELRVWLIDAVADGTDRSAFERQTAGVAPWASGSVRSGGSANFGRRESRAFLTGYDVEVATDSGVADPMIARAVVGDTLHLRACRVRRGTAVHLDGLLDQAQVGEVRRFDAGTPDVGVMEQPTLDVVQVAFSGVVGNGDVLAVTMAGTPLAVSERTLWIEVRATPDPILEEPGDAPPWRGVDLALLGTRVVDLPLPSPGSGLGDVSFLEQDVGVLTESFPAAAVAQFSDGARPARGRSTPVWTEGYLLVPPGDGDVWAEVQGVVGAVERDRLRTARLDVARGPLRVSIPAAEGYPVRVLVGREQTRLVDFDAHVAQESWMPWPRVETLFDGVLLQGHLRDGTLIGAGWIAETSGVRELPRADVRVGDLQLVDRTFQGDRVHVPAGEPRAVLSSPKASAALTVRVIGS
jgi:hypothetical protein